MPSNNKMGKQYVYVIFVFFPCLLIVHFLLLFVAFSGEHNFDRTRWLLGHDDRCPYHHVGPLHGHAQLRAANIRRREPWRPAATTDLVIAGQLSGS